jgi:hypothetical protein
MKSVTFERKHSSNKIIAFSDGVKPLIEPDSKEIFQRNYKLITMHLSVLSLKTA